MRKVLVVCLICLFICSMAYATAENKMRVVGTGNANVTTPGTAVQLSSVSVPVNEIILVGVFRHADGTMAVSHDVDKGLFIGDSLVNAGGVEHALTLANRKGILITSVDNIAIPGGDLNKIYVDSVNSHDGVSFMYFSD